MADDAVLSPEVVHTKLKEHGVTHIIWLPDSETNWLFLLLNADPDLTLIGVGREGNACAIAAGLYAGGAKPVILIQNTGMMEAGDSIRGWLISLNIPVVLLVGYRGYTRHGITKDTAATFTEPFLNAFRIDYYLVESDRDADRLSVAFTEAQRLSRPVVGLIADEFHGFNR
jgi:sulfopyruvate decarboxylase subunit alpha